MDSLNDAMAVLQRNCQASTTLMLVKALEESESSLGAIMIFDEIADYPAEELADSGRRERVVTQQLQKALTYAAEKRS
ncbi:hypothetical protein HNP46_000223 [Pseudomonas nitritireducens]|uniref:Uncharacterized protein n=1 Tax=Pseudomonas nitroreducens TaxID=46680 RepID=A0A7W7NZP0_PSENT|nr:hypothetical protein [Pseudomonas nitritireducens]MBB4861412.1 hypothetical protein [Pseudomonas nitritireducens]